MFVLFKTDIARHEAILAPQNIVWYGPFKVLKGRVLPLETCYYEAQES
jgi:hypothetical protein